MTTKVYPDDLDTTSIASTVLEQDTDIRESVLDGMLDYVNADGIFLVCYSKNSFIWKLIHDCHRHTTIKPVPGSTQY